MAKLSYSTSAFKRLVLLDEHQPIIRTYDVDVINSAALSAGDIVGKGASGKVRKLARTTVKQDVSSNATIPVNDATLFAANDYVWIGSEASATKINSVDTANGTITLASAISCSEDDPVVAVGAGEAVGILLDDVSADGKAAVLVHGVVCKDYVGNYSAYTGALPANIKAYEFNGIENRIWFKAQY